MHFYFVVLYIIQRAMVVATRGPLSCNSHFNCSCQERHFAKLTCNFMNTNFTIPSELSLDIQHIAFHGTNYTLRFPELISGFSWATLESLEIFDSTKIFTLPYNFFKWLSGMKLLRLKRVNLISIETEAFSNLTSLVNLDLSMNSRLYIASVQQGLKKFASNNLEVFNISGIHNAESTSPFSITDELFRPLSVSNLKVLDMSSMRAFSLRTSFELLPNLVCVNLSRTSIFGLPSCLSTLNLLSSLKVFVMDNWPVLARESVRLTSNYAEEDAANCSFVPFYDHTRCLIVPPALKVLSVRTVDENSLFVSLRNNFCVALNNTIEYFSIREMKTGNPLGAIFGLWSVKYIDISNIGTAFSAKMFLNMPNVETILASGSSLFKIENEPELNFFLSNNSRLKNVDLSKNDISFIPFNMFSNTIYIEDIDLSWNLIQNIGINFSACLILQRISLSHNRLKTIDILLFDHLDSIASKNTSSVELSILR